MTIPWRLEPESPTGEDRGGIYDATGAEICHFGVSREYDSAAGFAPSLTNGTLMAVAPEMEKLIRDRLGAHVQPGECLDCGSDLQFGEPHDDGCRVQSILGRIDAARKSEAAGVPLPDAAPGLRIIDHLNLLDPPLARGPEHKAETYATFEELLPKFREIAKKYPVVVLLGKT